MEKTDIRVRFTRKVLRESLITLMKEKSIQNISIKEICDIAGLSRSTFYTYYNDQYDLLRQIEEQTFIEMEQTIQRHTITARKPSNQEMIIILQDIFQYIINNSNSIQVLLSENGDNDFQKKFFRNRVERFRSLVEITSDKSQDSKMSRYGSVFMMGGMITLIQEWLKNGMDAPVMEMIKMLARLMRDALG